MTNNTTRLLLSVVVLALAGVVWLWVSRPKPVPAPAPPAPEPTAVPTKPVRPTPAAARVANPALGDVNADGVVDRADVEYLSQFTLGFGPQPIGPADVNHDGKVDARDVLFLANQVNAAGAGRKSGAKG